jgi:hypothetical protein
VKLVASSIQAYFIARETLPAAKSPADKKLIQAFKKIEMEIFQ